MKVTVDMKAAMEASGFHPINWEELFSLGDLAHVTGETEEGVMELVKDAGITPITVTAAPWLTGGTK